MHNNIRLAFAATLVLALVFLSDSVLATKGFMLLSPKEAHELQLDDMEWEKGVMPKSLGFGVGPQIFFKNPIVEETDKGLFINAPSEMDLLVIFEDGISPVDMNSLEIKARKGWFSKNLTKRLLPYINEKSIKADNVKIPSGRFKLEIKIADTAGNESVREYLCEIRDN
jgi:hypothetical protein